MSVTIGGVPEGATLNIGGVAPGADGTITVDATSAQIAEISMTPPENFSGDILLNVVATTSEDGTEANTLAELSVHVTGDADAPIVTVSDALGAEDSAIPLEIVPLLVDTDGSEIITNVTVSGVPEGAELSAGTDNADGTWTLLTSDLVGITVTPPPNASGEFSLAVSVTTTEADGDSATTTSTLNVSVDAVADGPRITVADAAGAEDTAISLNIGAALTDTDGSESLGDITISGVPAGAELSAGTDNGDGSWTLTPGDLAGLTVTPPADSDADFSMTVSASSVEANGDTAESSTTLFVDVTGVADQPLVSVVDPAVGLVNEPILLEIGVALADTDGSESITEVVISGVPSGAVLSAGTDLGDGSWTVAPADLPGLTLTPEAGSNDDFNFMVTATSTEDGGDTATTVSSLNVVVTGGVTAPVVTIEPVSGAEDTAIPLDIAVSLTTADLGESITDVTISGLPDGAVLSAGTDNGDGTWTLFPAQLTGLAVTPPPDSGDDFSFTVAATVTDSEGDTAISGHTVDVAVTGVADQPSVTVSDAAGFEDGAIPLRIGAAVTDTDGSEAITDITVSGVPEGAVLSAGTDNGDGTWTLSPVQLTGLTITPPPDSGADFTLTVSATATEADGDTATTVSTLNVEVSGVADEPIVSVSSVEGEENTAIPLDLEVALADTDGSESITDITISGVPAGAQLSACTDNLDGTWSLTPDQTAGLTITPPPDDASDFVLNASATSQDIDPDTGAVTTETTVVAFDVAVTGVAEEPIVTVTTDAGFEDAAIDLNISVALPVEGGTQAITEVVISGVPEGAQLSAGTDNGDGTWTLARSDLSGLEITPPENSSDDMTLTVTATVTDIDPDTGAESTATSNLVFDVAITGVADVPQVTIADAVGAEDSAIPLDIGVALADLDGSETITDITVSGVPADAELSAGTDNGDGTWTLTPAELSGLSVTPPANSDAEFSLTVTATATEADGDSATAIANLYVTVTSVADAPTVAVTDVTGDEDSTIPLDIGVALADADGSESITNITISGVPAGAQLSAGTDNGDGTWTLLPGNLPGLTIDPLADSADDFVLTVSATSTDTDGDSATTVSTLNVTVTGVADVPTVTVADAAGAEDSAIQLDIGVALNDIDGSETITDITVSGVPSGAQLSAGTRQSGRHLDIDSGPAGGADHHPAG